MAAGRGDRGAGAGLLDTSSFLPGPEKLAPIMRERVWKNRIDREEQFALGGPSKAPAPPGREVDSERRNPITWETPCQSRLATASSIGGGCRRPDVLSLLAEGASDGGGGGRLGSAMSSASRLSVASSLMRARARGVRSSSHSGISKRLSTAGSYVSTARTASSALAEELEEERRHRLDAEREVANLKAELAAASSKASS